MTVDARVIPITVVELHCKTRHAVGGFIKAQAPCAKNQYTPFKDPTLDKDTESRDSDGSSRYLLAYEAGSVWRLSERQAMVPEADWRCS